VFPVSIARRYKKGKRFPAAKREAETVLGELPQPRRTWLIDLYLFPPLGVGRALSEGLLASARAFVGDLCQAFFVFGISRLSRRIGGAVGDGVHLSPLFQLRRMSGPASK
jgi:hypothetical protein